MPDIFDQLAAAKKNPKSGDIFDQIASQSQPSDPTQLANSVLGKYGLSVKAPKSSISPAGTLPTDIADKLAVPSVGGFGHVPVQAAPTTTDYSDNPITRAAISTGAHLPTPSQIAVGAITNGPMVAPLMQARKLFQQRGMAAPQSLQDASTQLAPELGIDPNSVKQNAANGDIPGLFGDALGPISAILGGNRLLGSVGEPNPNATYPAIPKEDVVNGIYQSVNPPVGDVRGFKANLGNQLDTVINHAAENKLPLGTREDFSTALQSAAKADPYRSTFIDPYENELVSKPRGFQGQTTVDDSHTTIGNLDARLSRINDTLSPRYMSGGAGSTKAQAAIGAEQAADLQAEANAIRGTLAGELSKRTGVDSQVIRSARANYEQLNSLSEDVQDSINNENFLRNKAAGEPLTVGSAVQAAKNIPLNPSNWRSNPLGAVRDRMLSSALQGYTPGPKTVFNINPPGPEPPAPANPIRTPLYQQVNTSGINPTTFHPYTPEELAQLQSQQRGAVNYRANTNALRGREARADAAGNARITQDRLADRQRRISDLLRDQPPPRPSRNPRENP